MNNLRWNPYVLMNGKESIIDFWDKYFNENSRVLFIMGKDLILG